MKSKIKYLILAGVGLLFIMLFYLPVLIFIFKPFTESGTIGDFGKLLCDIGGSAKFHGALGISLLQSSLSSLISLVIAFPLSYIASRYNFRLAGVFRSITIIPFVLPGIVVIVAMTSLLGANGLISNVFGMRLRFLYGIPGILISHVFYNISISFRFLEEGWDALDIRYRQISKSFGESRISYIRKVVLPEMLPNILSAFVIVFVYCFFSFAIVLVFGGLKFSTLEVHLYNTFANDVSGKTTAIYGFYQMLLSIFLILTLIIISNIKKRRSNKVINKQKIHIKYLKPIRRIVINFLFSLIILLILLPLLSLFIMSFIKDGVFTIENYINLFNPGNFVIVKINVLETFFKSLSISVPAGITAVVLSLLLSLIMRNSSRSIFESLVILPIGISTVSLSYGVSYIFGSYFNTYIVIILIHTVLAFPISFRILKTAIDRYPNALSFVARSLGANRFYAFRTVELPLYMRSIGNALSYSIAVSLSDITVIFVIGRGNIVTIPMAVYKLISSYQFGEALSLSTLYILLLFMIFSVIDRSLLKD